MISNVLPFKVFKLAAGRYTPADVVVNANLAPALGDVDLGNDVGLQFSAASVEDFLDVPVRVNAASGGGPSPYTHSSLMRSTNLRVGLGLIIT